MGRDFNEDYSEEYKNQVFAIWYLHGHTKIGSLLDFIEPDDRGRTPNPTTIQKWREQGGWDARSQQLDIEVQQKTDRELVSLRMEMMKRHAKKAEEIQEMSFAYLQETGFDSSASAVSALFKAFDEEKKSRGMEIALTQVFTMNDENLQKTMNRLLGRVRGIGNEEDSDVVVLPEEVDATSDEQTSDE